MTTPTTDAPARTAKPGSPERAGDSLPAIEIERKFVVAGVPADLERFPAEAISQGYLAIAGDVEVRLRRRGGRTMLTVKTGLGRTRGEEAVPIDQAGFERLWPLTEGRRVEKVRHLVPAGDGLTIELDRFGGRLEGLTTAEVEFDSESRADAFEPPRWLGPEVTDDPRYKNQSLACHGAPPPPRAAPEPFRLHRGEAVPEGIRRIVRGQIDAAIDDLGAGIREDPGSAVHACRKHFKRVRATVRLAREELGDDVYRRENATFREFGQRLSGARDRRVLVETLDALCARCPFELPRGAFARLRAALVADYDATERRLRQDTDAAGPDIADLRATRRRATAWSFEHDDGATLASGFERIYRRGRRAFRAVRADPSDENVHELRKRTKDVWHAAQILRRAEPRTMRKLADRAHRLSDLLGDDHDLVVLSQQVDRHPEWFNDEAEAGVLGVLIDRRRRQVQGEAIKLGQRVFAAGPRKLLRQVGLASISPAP